MVTSSAAVFLRAIVLINVAFATRTVALHLFERKTTPLEICTVTHD
jgi:hypothetical protein